MFYYTKTSEEGVIYKVNCKDCNKIYNEETKFGMGKRMKQHWKDVEYERIDYNAIARQVKEEHKVDWENAVVLEKERRQIPRKILEGTYICKNRQRCMNLNEGLGVSAVYRRGEGAWLRRGN